MAEGVNSNPGEVSASQIQDEVAENGFVRIPLDGKRVIYANPNNSLVSYDNWLIKPAVVEFHENQKPLKKEDVRALQKMLEEMQYSQTAETGGKIVNEPTPCTLQQSLQLKHLRLNTIDNEAPSQRTVMRSFGSAVVMAEIRDAHTGEIVFAYTAAASLGGGVTGGDSGPQLARLKQVLNRALAQGNQAVFKRFPLSPDDLDNLKDRGCTGELGRIAFGRRGVKID